MLQHSVVINKSEAVAVAAAMTSLQFDAAVCCRDLLNYLIASITALNRAAPLRVDFIHRNSWPKIAANITFASETALGYDDTVDFISPQGYGRPANHRSDTLMTGTRTDEIRL